MQMPKMVRLITSPKIKEFVFLPGTFRIGADPKLTVITGYLKVTNTLLKAVKHRRTQDQTGEPIAIIAAYDAEYDSTSLFCIDDNDTQCIIKLRGIEEAYLHTALCEAVIVQYQLSPVVLLNKIRTNANLPTL